MTQLNDSLVHHALIGRAASVRRQYDNWSRRVAFGAAPEIAAQAERLRYHMFPGGRIAVQFHRSVWVHLEPHPKLGLQASKVSDSAY